MNSFSDQPQSYTARLAAGGTVTITAGNLNQAVDRAATHGHVRAIDTTARMEASEPGL